MEAAHSLRLESTRLTHSWPFLNLMSVRLLLRGSKEAGSFPSGGKEEMWVVSSFFIFEGSGCFFGVVFSLFLDFFVVFLPF